MRYPTAAAFRMALEERIRQRSAADGVAIQRLRKRVAFERFLARLQAPPDSPWFLKGAFALDLRFGDRSRTTKDLDLAIDLAIAPDVPTTPAGVTELLQAAAAYELDDFIVFRVPAEGEQIQQEPSAHTYRFHTRALLDRRPFEDFKVDVGTVTPLVAPTEEIPESDTLLFAGIVPRRFRAISLAQHFAEKIHALTFPREDRENTRVKDLVDIMLILEVNAPDPGTARNALQAVFAGRGTHSLPSQIHDPPPSWTASYTATARELTLTHVTIEDATRFLNQFLDQSFSVR